MSQWYCRVGGVESGPFSIDELRFLKARGKLQQDSLIRPASDESWQSATSIPGLFSNVRKIDAPKTDAAEDNSASHQVPLEESPEEMHQPVASEPSSPPPESDQRHVDRPSPRPPRREALSRPPRRRRRKLAALIGGGLLVLFVLLLFLLSWLAGTMSQQLADRGDSPDGAGQASDAGSTPSAASDNSDLDKASPPSSDDVPREAAAPSGDEPDAAASASAEEPSATPERTEPAADPVPTPKAKVLASLPDPSQEKGGGDGHPGSTGGGDGRSSRFFGVDAEGKGFVYIVDRSGSMSSGRFDRAKKELVQAIRRLEPQQTFYVYFFTEFAIPITHSKAPTPKLIPASSNNVKEFEAWIEDITATGGSDGGDEAIDAALQLNPDAVFFLSDGEFDGSAAGVIRVLNVQPTVPINTIGFEDRIGEALLRQIAEDSGGTYRFVP